MLERDVNLLDPGDCFFGLTGRISAFPDEVFRRQRVHIEWSGSNPGIGCPPVTWWIASPDWREVPREGSIDIDMTGGHWVALAVTAHDRVWSRGLASVYVDVLVVEKPPKNP
jgi:hypothetical protein